MKETLDGILGNRKPDEQRQCETHGEYTSKNFLGAHWTACPVCTEEQKQAEAEQEAEKAIEQERKRRELRWRAKLGGASIPERFRDRTLESYKAETPGQEKALAFAKEYAENFDQVMETGRCAIFVGKPGTGKTHLAIGIALHIMKQDR